MTGLANAGVTKAGPKTRLYVIAAALMIFVDVEAALQGRLAPQTRLHAQQPLAPQSHSRLFPPIDLGLLESPDRARLLFRQIYRSGPTRIASDKLLVMVRRAGQWVIQQERVEAETRM